MHFPGTKGSVVMFSAAADGDDVEASFYYDKSIRFGVLTGNPLYGTGLCNAHVQKEGSRLFVFSEKVGIT